MEAITIIASSLIRGGWIIAFACYSMTETRITRESYNSLSDYKRAQLVVVVLFAALLTLLALDVRAMTPRSIYISICFVALAHYWNLYAPLILITSPQTPTFVVRVLIPTYGRLRALVSILYHHQLENAQMAMLGIPANRLINIPPLLQPNAPPMNIRNHERAEDDVLRYLNNQLRPGADRRGAGEGRRNTL